MQEFILINIKLWLVHSTIKAPSHYELTQSMPTYGKIWGNFGIHW